MWFFIPLGFKYGDEPDGYWHVSNVFGPYENEEAVEDALSRLWPNDKKEHFLVFEGKVAKATPSVLEKAEDEKREPGNMDNYEPDGERYKCKECGAHILSAKVAHPIHYREMPGAGSGECEYETVPYCPNCEKKPVFHGEPIVVSMFGGS